MWKTVNAWTAQGNTKLNMIWFHILYINNSKKCYNLIIPKVHFSDSLQQEQNYIYIIHVMREEKLVVCFFNRNEYSYLIKYLWMTPEFKDTKAKTFY